MKLFLLMASFVVLLPVAHAKGGNSRFGGLGTLFTDHNSFANYGSFSQNPGFGIETQYTRGLTGTAQTAGASAVYGGKGFGMGVSGVRNAPTSFTTGYTDVIDAGLGFSLFKDKMTFGAGYNKGLNSAAGGTIGANLTFYGSGMQQGFTLGAGFGYAMAPALAGNSATVGIGYGFKNMSNIAAEVSFPDITNFRNFVGGAYYTFTGRVVYLGLGYNLNNIVTMSHTVMGRLGFILGKLDLSVFTTYPLAAGATPSIGGSLRLTF